MPCSLGKLIPLLLALTGYTASNNVGLSANRACRAVAPQAAGYATLREIEGKDSLIRMSNRKLTH